MRRALWCALAATSVLVSTLPALGVGAAAAPAKCSEEKDPGGSWPFYGHDLANSRTQPREDKIDTAAAMNLSPAWVFSVADAGFEGTFESTPVVVNGCVFVATNAGHFVALDAETGEIQWKSKLKHSPRGASLAVADGKVFGNLSPRSRPTVVALDQRTGEILWETITDRQKGALSDTSPMVWNDKLFIGVASTDGEPEEVRRKFQGNYLVLDADSGRILAKGWLIPDGSKRAGAGVWTTGAIDTRGGYAYVGGGNPYGREHHPNANALVKVDVDPKRKTFGKIVATYLGTNDRYVRALKDVACPDLGDDPIFLTECNIDLDFGSSPNLFRDGDGKLIVGTLQKSGVYHALDAASMKLNWSAVIGPPTPFGNASSGAFDGSQIITIASPPGHMLSLDPASGTPNWATPVGSGAHYNPVSVANGVAYTVDLRGVFSAYDTATGVPLVERPVAVDVGTAATSTSSGVSIARHKVFVALGGFIVAYAP